MKQILTILFLLSFASVNAVTINVPADQPTIQAGINAAANSDTVLVQPGTYVENINFNGKLITVGSLFLTTQDTTYISSTIIDGNSNDSVVKFENGEASTAVLYGFTITNGLVFGLESNGGGVYCYESSPTLTNLLISNNATLGSGGGIYCYESSLTLSNLVVSGNTTVEGGGIYCEDSSPTLTSLEVIGNSAFTGGGIYFIGTNPILNNVIISQNYAEDGGGIYCRTSNPILNYVLISNNDAVDNDFDGSGGGIFCDYESSLDLENVTMSGNTASYAGGGIWCNSSISTSLKNTILWNNIPEEIYIYSGSITATYSDIQGGWTGIGNIDSDPLFVDSANGDYHLTENSPCIDAGDPASPLDPDGTITDMGAYYYYQDDIPPTAEFTSDVSQGYSPLTINFTDLSIHGSVVIDEWYWDFGDGNNSSLQNPSNEYQLPGIYTVSLTVTDVNDSIDTEIKVDYITVYSNDSPAAPTNVLINISGDDAIITWDAVNTTIYGDPCVIDGYIVYYNEMPDEEHFWFLGFTTNTDYTHVFVAQFSEQMFYNVVAYVDLGEDELNYLKELNNTSRKVSQLEMKRELSRKRK